MPRQLIAIAAIAVTGLVFVVAAGDGNAAAHGRGPNWVATWTGSLQGPDPIVTNTGFDDETVREIVHTSIGGNRLRVRVSNLFGVKPLVVGAAHVALSSSGARAVAGSDRALQFGGATSTTIAPGAQVVSDPVTLHVRPLADLAISLFVPGETGFATWHWTPSRTTYVSPAGDFAGATTMPVARTTDSVYWVTGVDVQEPAVSRALVAFGDSITEGFNTTPDANQTWPNDLASRLAPERHPRLAVVDGAIDGNRLLHDSVGPNGVGRFERDVLEQPGVAEVAIMMGTNDLLFPGTFAPTSESVTAGAVIAALQDLADRAHAHGLAAIGCTLTPFEGASPLGVPEDWQKAEPKREAINRWIRTSGAFDAVFDFDAVLRDPAHPSRLRAEFDSGDHLHPSDAGQTAMAAAIDLRVLENLASATARRDPPPTP